jgi:glucosamine--fructose-6-phosphate aminotransferase (isomerizing)
MCGIVGYVGPRPCVDLIVEGLRRLEYRGYDSAGIAVVGPRGLDIRRSKGKLANLASRLRDQPLEGTTGIGHTRWATTAGSATGSSWPPSARWPATSRPRTA